MGEPTEPDAIGPFRVVGVLGRGGMGVVYEAIDLDVRRRVAVKVLRDDLAGHAGFVRGFVKEGRITGQLEHPAIVPVHRLGLTDEGRPYLVMRRVEGQTLAQRLRQDGPLAPALLRAMATVCHAVAYAHARGVVHCDLKPANLLLGSYGEVFVLDWGVAVLVEDEGRSDVYGTPGYIDPRLLDGPADPASDVFSLGAILFEVATGLPAFPGEGRERIERAAAGAPDPRARAPVPRVLAELVLAALGPVADRPTAEALAVGIEDFLEGRRRRQEAARLVQDARGQHREAVAAAARTADLQDRVDTLAATVPPWSPLDDKRELLALRRELEKQRLDEVQRFERMVATCERALEHDPGHPAARAFLADRYLERLLASEEEGDALQVARWHARVEAFDDGRLAPLLEGTGRLRLDTVPSGARVVARRFDTSGLLWRPREAIELGTTPVDVTLGMGSWLLTLEHPDRPPIRYPVLVPRSGTWEASGVWLPEAGVVPRGFRYVPAGPFLRGGDPEPGARPRCRTVLGAFAIGELPVTLGDYVAWLNDLPLDEAFARCPRQDVGVDRSDGPRLLPVPEVAGRWEAADPDHPVHSIDWEDARAYAAWRGARLPLEDEWEKAARGVDGRLYPWGDEFDPSLCKMSLTDPGTPTLAPVGLYPTDRSVYGVRDLAGGMRCWCGDAAFDGDPERRPVRGGSFATSARVSRSSARYGSPPRHPLPYQGIRLAWTLEPGGST